MYEGGSDSVCKYFVFFACVREVHVVITCGNSYQLLLSL